VSGKENSRIVLATWRLCDLNNNAIHKENYEWNANTFLADLRGFNALMNADFYYLRRFAI
jgi:hypothetical protein